MSAQTLANIEATYVPMRRKLRLPSQHDLYAECVQLCRREEERRRQLARKQERNGKRSQAFV